MKLHTDTFRAVSFPVCAIRVSDDGETGGFSNAFTLQPDCVFRNTHHLRTQGFVDKMNSRLKDTMMKNKNGFALFYMVKCYSIFIFQLMTKR